ncbi:MAG: hypothetical protein IT459_04385 [Planctomycetes bacterium]|nr:hypothetical protein [Planctomycetota bacterium]
MSAATRATLHQELAALYAALDTEVRATAVRCDLRGVCCDFEKAGHVLYATDLEVDFARDHGGAAPPEAAADACPFFRSNQCHLREGRPLGCRVYFCDPAYAEAMHDLAERYHRRVVALHEAHGVAYRYAPFVRTIREEPRT